MSLQKRVMLDNVVDITGPESGATNVEDLSLCDILGATTLADHPGGSTDDLVAWLQVSFDGLNWFDMPYDIVSGTAEGVTIDVIADTFKRNFSQESPPSFPGRNAIFKHLPADLVRVQWGAEGTEEFDLTSIVLTGK